MQITVNCKQMTEDLFVVLVIWHFYNELHAPIFSRVAIFMIVFSTEFPVVASENRAAFVAEILAWLRGMQHQTVLSQNADAELDGSNVLLRSPGGEELRMRELKTDDIWSAIGIRHDFPDNKGRAWRTDCVLQRDAADDGQDLVRLRTQCIAKEAGAFLEPPRKPYLIKALLKGSWGGVDQGFTVSDRPIWLTDNDQGIATATAITLGKAAKWLPTVYISAKDGGDWLLSRNAIEKLAYDLGGVAHVVVEPGRAFSFQLREKTDARNAYAGTIGLSIPGRGIVRRYYLGWQYPNGDDLAVAVKTAATTLRSHMPAFGYDWTELQEQALRSQRARDRNRLSADESEKLYLDEIENLQDRIRQLEQQVSDNSDASLGTNDAEFSAHNLVQRIGPEIYPGEISDRLRLAADMTLSTSEQTGLDGRSKLVLQRFVAGLPPSPALTELRQDLERATKKPKGVAKQLTAVLSRHGYMEKADNKHVRLEPLEAYDGLDSITLPKTPRKYSALENLRKQIERTLGIIKLGN